MPRLVPVNWQESMLKDIIGYCNAESLAVIARRTEMNSAKDPGVLYLF